MAHIRRKLLDTPSPNIRLAYVVVITSGWTAPLEEHPKVVDYPDLYEITNDEIPTDTTLWSIEFEDASS